MATTARSFRVKLETVFRWQSLRTRLTIFILTIFLLSIWSLALYASRMLHGDMERMLGEQQFSTVSIVAARVNQELSDRLRAVEKIASGITPAMLKDPAFVQRYLKHCMVIEVFFSGGLFVTPTDGRVIADVASPRGPRIGINYSDREWMGEVLKGKAVISEPVVGKMSRKPGFAIAAPVFGGSGEVVGAVVGVVDLEWPSFLDEITGRRFGKSGSYFVIAPRQKVVVTSTNRNLVMRPLSPLSMNPLTKRYLQGYEGSGIAVDPWGRRGPGVGEADSGCGMDRYRPDSHERGLCPDPCHADASPDRRYPPEPSGGGDWPGGGCAAVLPPSSTPSKPWPPGPTGTRSPNPCPSPGATRSGLSLMVSIAC